MEQKPHKKEELLVANNVLKLASELLKVTEHDHFVMLLQKPYKFKLFELPLRNREFLHYCVIFIYL
jgi:hypothetical protein